MSENEKKQQFQGEAELVKIQSWLGDFIGHIQPSLRQSSAAEFDQTLNRLALILQGEKEAAPTEVPQVEAQACKVTPIKKTGSRKPRK